MSYRNIKFSKTRETRFELSSEDEARLKELQEHLEKDQIQYLWVTGKDESKYDGKNELIGIYVPIVKMLYTPGSYESVENYGYSGQYDSLIQL
jgi:hypothetical protein